MIEPMTMPTHAEVQAFLPPYVPQQRLDVDNPISMGPVGMPGVYTEAKMAGEAILQNAYGPICETLDEFGKMFGRQYRPVESYRTEDAEILLITMGSISETAMTWIDAMRAKGEKVGLVRFRLWRPLPIDDFKAAIKGAKVLSVLDRHFSPGGPGGPVAQEIKQVLYGQPGRRRSSSPSSASAAATSRSQISRRSTASARRCSAGRRCRRSS